MLLSAACAAVTLAAIQESARTALAMDGFQSARYQQIAEQNPPVEIDEHRRSWSGLIGGYRQSDVQSRSQPAGPSPNGSVGRSQPPAPVVLTDDATLVGGRGARCVRIGPTDGQPSLAGNAARWFPDIVDSHGVCEPAAASDAATLARQHAWARWFSVAPPAPDPVIAPGWMLVGKDAFLETNSELSARWVFAVAELGETLTLSGVGHYHVDWGDGHVSGPHHDPGAPWPDGEVRHLYQHTGEVTVVITHTWTGTWTLGVHSGELPARTRQASLTQPVHEVQAVRNR